MKTKILSLFLALAGICAQAQVNYGINGSTAYVTNSPNASGNVVIASTYNGYPVLSIVENAFGDCTSLASVTIPASVTSIGIFAFVGCTSLTNIAVSASNPDYSSTNGVLFNQAQTTLIQFHVGLGGSYTIPASVTTIGEFAFYDCPSLTNVTIPASVTAIDDYAFQICSGLTSVTIPNSVTSIGISTFQGCFGLTSVTIPASVTSIGTGAFDEVFDDCTSLTNIAVSMSNPDYSSANGVLFDKAQTTLLQFPGGLDESYTISNTVTSIGEDAFAFCFGLTSVTIPNSVTRCSGTDVTSARALPGCGNGPLLECAHGQRIHATVLQFIHGNGRAEKSAKYPASHV